MREVQTRPDLAVLIVGYKSLGDLGPCLESLFAQTVGVTFDVWFTNNSTDGAEAMIAERFPRVRIVPHVGNIGFAAGNNLLAQHAIENTRPAYLLLLNPDTVLLDNAVGTLLEFAKAHQEGGVWGGVPDLPNGQPDPGARQWRQSLAHVLMQTLGLTRFCRAGPPRTAEFEGDVPACSGAFMLADAALWQQLGGFDERYVMYSEESDFCYRVEKAGRRVLMTGRARLRHNVGSGSPVAHRRVVAIARGRMTFMRIHHSRLEAGLVGALTWAQYLRRWVIASITRRGTEAAATYRRMWTRPGEWWGGWAGRTIDGSPTGARQPPPTAPSAGRAGVVR